MSAEIRSLIDQIRQSSALLRRRLDWDTATKRLDELTALSERPGFWNDPQEAQKLMRERQKLADGIAVVQALEKDVSDAPELMELAEGDPAMLADLESSLARSAGIAQKAELAALLSGEADGNDCYVQINAGEGGTESQDWASILRRMYVRWAEKHGYQVEELDEREGEEAGIKSATIQVKGENAYGWLKSETGVHRLVRISPYDSSARRHTSFSSVSVTPVIDDKIEIEINPSDVRTDTFRASGAGGQHINRTDSAVRLTHIPTNTVVQCQMGRSQHQNRDEAWKMLRSKLYELELQKRKSVADAQYADKSAIGFGHQIRSYVLQPYQMVKDLRTDVETSDTGGVLDGDIDRFLSASLAASVAKEEAS
ncbi:MAG: peptide chain release factor 2 [Hyphomonas sp.]|uniref:peptide chain release factor 2 n=1 Tax=Hyphomonas sp. TaxID=87 RepID=UPI0017F30210|nr:peptide chain release factor 2 [Hyphomonas sp.]MBA3069795.1 peptide chain release factor 2 [Hyphomonas sp.]MBU3919772.1 peptide chain release factor 2 [Alphaproteobacteria bacterium]MBU4062636.1 peptide chain release factor 2 [Alphaproteobacteria bacterium]MBU4163987.1 peptide chain release factor 2 [Alphaproteobacteria bacterium]